MINERLIGELFNKDLALLRGLLHKNPLYIQDENKESERMFYYRNEDVREALFLSNLSKLHKYTHQKIAHAKKLYADRECDMLSDFVNAAWYYGLEANRNIPKTKAEYEYRQRCISSAISSLKKMEVSMVSLFILMDYSENTMCEWSTIFNDTVKCLYGLRKSDKTRFGQLK